jgi:phosphate transport system permease protein
VRETALAIGASPVQVVFHHVLPLALPGILTGTIIGTSRALGETAPLLLIGMRAFIPSAPDGLTDPATALPVQIFLWSDQAGGGFVEKTSAAILVLLGVLLLINGVAVWLRHRFEVRR